MTIKFYSNTKIMNNTYTFNDSPVSNYDYVNNLSYMLGTCTNNHDKFTPYLLHLVDQGILTKFYDTNSDYIEASYEFNNQEGEIEFFGANPMSYTLTYNF